MRAALLAQGYKLLFDAFEEWWQDDVTRDALFDQGYNPPFDIPEEWWKGKWTRRFLRRLGHPPPDPYSVEETEDEGEDEESTAQEAEPDRLVSPQDQPLTGGETLSRVVPPSDPLHTQPVTPAHPTTTAGMDTAGHQRRGFRKTMKNLFRR